MAQETPKRKPSKVYKPKSSRKTSTPLSDEALIKHIQENDGHLLSIAHATGYNYGSLVNRISKSPTLKKAKEDAIEQTIDKVENAFFKNCFEGNVTAQIFFLKTRARHRGYVEKAKDDSRLDLEHLNKLKEFFEKV